MAQSRKDGKPASGRPKQLEYPPAAAPATESLRVGTSGWHYEDWVGRFYPKSLPPDLKLRFYAEVFSTCEIDSSFYHIPAEKAAAKWARETPPDFTFSAKMPKAVTHDAMLDPDQVQGPLQLFLHNMRPLEEAGKMDFYLLQLPPKFSLPEHKGRLATFLQQWDPARKLAVEFRHLSWVLPPEILGAVERHASQVKGPLRLDWTPGASSHSSLGIPVATLLESLGDPSWQDPANILAREPARETLQLLREHQAAYTTVIEPLLPPIVAVTDPRGTYIRFHGFGKRPWFNYDFQSPEISAWATQVSAMLPQVKQVNAYWNNHFSGYAVKNAIELLKTLHAAPKQEPAEVSVLHLKQAKGLVPKGQGSLDTFWKK